MQGFRLPATVLNLSRPRGLPSLQDGTSPRSRPEVDETTSPEIDEELKLPKKASLVIVLLSNVMLQVRQHLRVERTINEGLTTGFR